MKKIQGFYEELVIQANIPDNVWITERESAKIYVCKETFPNLLNISFENIEMIRVK